MMSHERQKYICSSFHVTCSGFLDLALGILKMLIPFYDILQPASVTICSCRDMTFSQVVSVKYSKGLLFTSISTVQEHFQSNKRNKS